MTHFTRRNFIHAGAGAVLLASIPCGAKAQTKPDTLRILCGYPPGSPPDFVARHVGEKLAGVYAKTVVIDSFLVVQSRYPAPRAVPARPVAGRSLTRDVLTEVRKFTDKISSAMQERPISSASIFKTTPPLSARIV